MSAHTCTHAHMHAHTHTHTQTIKMSVFLEADIIWIELSMTKHHSVQKLSPQNVLLNLQSCSKSFQVGIHTYDLELPVFNQIQPCLTSVTRTGVSTHGWGHGWVTKNTGCCRHKSFVLILQTNVLCVGVSVTLKNQRSFFKNKLYIFACKGTARIRWSLYGCLASTLPETACIRWPRGLLPEGYLLKNNRVLYRGPR